MQPKAAVDGDEVITTVPHEFPSSFPPQDAVDDEEAAASASEEDWMARAAALARAAPGPTLGLLVELLRGAKTALFQCTSQGGTLFQGGVSRPTALQRTAQV